MVDRADEHGETERVGQQGQRTGEQRASEAGLHGKWLGWDTEKHARAVCGMDDHNTRTRTRALSLRRCVTKRETK